jgi:hypothetical protein
MGEVLVLRYLGTDGKMKIHFETIYIKMGLIENGVMVWEVYS